MHWKKLFLILTVLGLLAPIGLGSATASQLSIGTEPALSVTETENGLNLIWQADDPTPTKNLDGSWDFAIPGFDALDQPGTLRLPISSVLIALPPDASPNLEITAAPDKSIALPGTLGVAAVPQGVQRAPDGAVLGGGWAPADESIPFAHGLVEFTEIGVLRGVRLARLSFYPLQPDDDGLRFTPEVRITLEFGSQTLLAAAPPGPDAFSTILRGEVINPGQVIPAERDFSSSPMKIQAEYPTAVIEIVKHGLMAVTYADLAAINFPVDAVDPHNLHLKYRGAAAAYEWDGDDDHSFEAGERLLFFSNPHPIRWTNTDAYILTAQDTPGVRMATRAAAPEEMAVGAKWVTQYFEENQIYMPNCMCGTFPTGHDGDRWVWDELWKPDQTERAYAFTLNQVDPAQGGTLTTWMIGRTSLGPNPDHRVEFRINGVSVGALSWDGQKMAQAVLDIPAGILVEGENTLQLALAGLPGIIVEAAWLDAFRVSYALSDAAPVSMALFSGEATPHAYYVTLASIAGLRAYQVTTASQPVKLSQVAVHGQQAQFADPAEAGPQTYLVVSEDQVLTPEQLRLAAAPKNVAGAGFDYVIITHRDFATALSPLVALREAQGLRVVVEDVQAIYDHFGAGLPTPDAIHNYLAEAYQTWDYAPTYVLLVGDGNYDPKGYHENSSTSFIPPYLFNADPWMGETAADNRFVTVDGDDALPDMLLGRLPVNTLSEAQTVVEKIVRYEQSPMWGSWNARVMLTADNADASGDFAAFLDDLAANYISAPFYPVKNYYNPDEMSLEEMQATVWQGWNQGAGLSIYAGHSSILQWGGETFIHTDDIASLKNGPQLPVALDLTCFTGSFHIPAFSTLDETFLRHPQGGAVAVWGPTGLGVQTGHDELVAGFLSQVYVQHNPGIGAATLAGKIRLLNNNPLWSDLVDTFVLLGDPATNINLDTTREPASTLYLPVVQQP